MTKEQTTAWAREAGVFETRYNPVVYSATPEALERFAALVAAAERHECAKIVDGNADGCNGMTEQILRSNAAAIRARGNA